MSVFRCENLKKFKEKQNKIKKPTIMIVDDEAAHLSSMESFLSEDYHIISAQSGQEALDFITGMDDPESINLIISDQRMPGLTGIELFEKLLLILPKTIRIILTGFVDIPVIIDAVNKAQIYEFISKPFEPEDLKLRIKRALEAFENQKKVDEYYRTLEEQNKQLEKKYKELEESKRKLEESSLIDPLTGLRNRRYIENFIQSDLSKVQKNGTKQVKSASDVIFYILDVDNLKSVNSSFNYKSGDAILTQFTAVLQQECHPSDILVRWGNDEFLVIICITDREQGHAQAEHIRQVIANHSFQLEDDQSTQLTCSIGFAAYPFLPQYPRALNWEQVVTIVEKALHAAQKSGGNAWIEIKGTKKTNPGNLYQQIRIELKSLIANGELAISSSIPDKNSIAWVN
ncbi:MAG: diguanylate cyclase [Acidobacteria bacterium]|jgi:diguanylate cyclase (GGDEF)-like protein|nr:diguanylate cyclase [Acidobacteriota bacterium]